MPGRLPRPASGDRYEAALAWLEGELDLPAKLRRTLEAEQGIKLAGDRLRLRLFPPRISQYEPMQPELPLQILYEDDFASLYISLQGLKYIPMDIARSRL